MTRNVTHARREFGQGVEPPPQPPKLTTAGELLRTQEAAAPAAPEKSRAVATEVQAIYDGWPVVLKTELTPEQIPLFLGRLEKRGYCRPPVATAYTPNGEPICPKHREPMQFHEKQGDTWYSHKMAGPSGEECWCKGRPGKDSAGWSL